MPHRTMRQLCKIVAAGVIIAPCMAACAKEPTPAPAPSNQTAHPSPAPSSSAAQDYVDGIYRALPTEAGFDWRTARFAPQLRKLVDRERAQAGAAIGFMDAIPFCNCQDTMPDYRFTSRITSESANSASVTVQLHNDETQDFRIDLTQIDGTWYIADIHSADTPSLVDYLRTNLSRGNG